MSAGTGAVVVGGTIAGVGTLGIGLGISVLFASDSRPGNNQAFEAAMKENGIKKTDPLWREIHDALHNEPPKGYKDLLKFIREFLDF